MKSSIVFIFITLFLLPSCTGKQNKGCAEDCVGEIKGVKEDDNPVLLIMDL